MTTTAQSRAARALAALALAAGFGLLVATHAESAVRNRAQCYDRVIAVCNQKTNDGAVQACARAGLDACDGQFPQAADGSGDSEIRRLRDRVLVPVAVPAEWFAVGGIGEGEGAGSGGGGGGRQR